MFNRPRTVLSTSLYENPAAHPTAHSIERLSLNVDLPYWCPTNRLSFHEVSEAANGGVAFPLCKGRVSEIVVRVSCFSRISNRGPLKQCVKLTVLKVRWVLL